MNKNRVLVLSSGGIDSTACIKFYKNQKSRVYSLFIDFGQLSKTKELKASQKIAKYYKIPYSLIKIKNNIQYGSGLLIGRNAFLLTTALINFKHDTGIIAVGVHSGTSYSDCSENFIHEMQAVFDIYALGCIRVGAPFLNWSKADIYNFSKKEKIPLELTYSCELGKKQPCGKCNSCKDLEKLYALS